MFVSDFQIAQELCEGGTRIIERPMRIYVASHYAVSDVEGDYTVHVVVGVDPLGKLYILDFWRGQRRCVDALVGRDGSDGKEPMVGLQEPFVCVEERWQVIKV